MSQSSLRMPPGSGEHEPHLNPRSDRCHSETLQDFVEPEAVLSSVSGKVAAGDAAPEVLLQEITAVAQFVTAASGAALGMRRDTNVLCVGRSGEIAPELGALVSEDSGISGKCLRSGRTLECQDTEADTTVDAETCRILSIRSIAVVPVRCGNSVVGVLEVFSKSPRAFTTQQIDFLTALAGLVEIAASIGDRRPSPSRRIHRLLDKICSTELVTLLRVSIFAQSASWWQNPKWRYGLLAGFFVLAMLLIANWWTRPEPSQRTAQTVIAQSVPRIDHTSTATIPESFPKTESEFVMDTRIQNSVVRASKKEIDEPVVVRRFNVAPEPNRSTNSLRSPLDDEFSSVPPQIPSQNTHSEILGSIGAATVSIPALGIPVSRGVIPPVLEHRVNPVYPAQARTLRVAGTVVLEAWVNEKGRVEQVNLVSGNPLLGKAATEAVKEWRFRAAQLNGRPTKMQTRITINFQDSSSH